ncbi:hypothetical protein FUT84_07135 [Treponema phagedenis]|nr:hypothetical protein FUT84_07135 [Treponema phagedenis]QEK05957.1 hypothetical protein FUT80_04045 [Treponema phagedenis]
MDVKNSEPPRTAVVPRSSDVLKQSNLQSFKTRKFGFDMDVKNSEPPRAAVVPNRNDVLKAQAFSKCF